MKSFTQKHLIVTGYLALPLMLLFKDFLNIESFAVIIAILLWLLAIFLDFPSFFDGDDLDGSFLDRSVMVERGIAFLIGCFMALKVVGGFLSGVANMFS